MPIMSCYTSCIILWKKMTKHWPLYIFQVACFKGLGSKSMEKSSGNRSPGSDRMSSYQQKLPKIPITVSKARKWSCFSTIVISKRLFYPKKKSLQNLNHFFKKKNTFSHDYQILVTFDIAFRSWHTWNTFAFNLPDERCSAKINICDTVTSSS